MDKREASCGPEIAILQTQGIQLVDISLLERSAEALSQGGSDIGEEIRKLVQEQERSRQNSILSQTVNLRTQTTREGTPLGDFHLAERERERESHTYAHSSIIDINSTARLGGYSPSAFIPSPTGSVRSCSHGSWSHASTSLSRAASTSKSSLARARTRTRARARMVVEPLQEGHPLHSPLPATAASLSSHDHPMSRQPSQSSFSRRYDQIASQIEESLQSIPPTPPIEQRMHPIPQQHQHEQHHIESEPPERPHSTDTFQEAQTAFKDFDGVHFDPDSEEYVEVDDAGNEVRRISARNSSGSLLDAASLLRSPRASRPISHGVPPPNDSMVYYPAPVPRILNLPKRLSQQPAAHVKAQRRSQMLAQMSPGARESAPWIPPMTFTEETESQQSGSGSAPREEQPRGMLNERMNTHSSQNLPAQLRASMFFEHSSVPHNVEVKSESAVATLDAILASSVTAPVTAFTDHPYVGDVRKTVYAAERPDQNRKSTATTLGNTSTHSPTQEKKLKKRRSSSIGNFFRRSSTGVNGEVEDSRPAGRGGALDFNEGGNKLRKRRSQLSLGGGLASSEGGLRTPADEIEDPMRRISSSGLVAQASNNNEDHGQTQSDSRPRTSHTEGNGLSGGDQITQDFKDQEELSDIDDNEVFYAQPTTLLAELQVRKAQLKSRNRTAATAFPNGMHSTLLQLDAVEQIEAEKRKKHKIALAWEDPSLRSAEDDGEDEDVPLGVLFPTKEGNSHRRMGNRHDWNRPLGLIEKRELEDNEPLSSRRFRMNPHARPIRNATAPMALPGQQMQHPADERDEETLGQRLRRLKTKEALDLAISDVAPKEGERPDSTFTEELLGQFGGLEVKNPDPASDHGTTKDNKGNQEDTGADQEETLGQRRARLQRERVASGELPPSGTATRPPLRSTQSMANVLSANPIGMRDMSREQSAARGTLLHASEKHQMKQKMDLLDKNSRSSSYMLGKPLVNSRPQTTLEPTVGLLAQTTNRPANGLYQSKSNVFQGATTADNPLQKTQSYGGLLGLQSSRPANGAFAGGFYNNNGGGASMQQPMLGVGGGLEYAFASPTAGMQAYNGGYGNNGMVGGQYVLQSQQASMINNTAYHALHGGHTSMMPGTMPSYGNPMMAGGYGYPQQTQAPQITYASQAQMGYPVAMGEVPIEPHQRDAIDRWRMGVA